MPPAVSAVGAPDPAEALEIEIDERATWRGLTRNTLVTIAGSLVSLAVALVTVPWYLGLIGAARYGALAFMIVILSYFTVFDFGLDRAVANRIAQIDPSDHRRVSTVFWSGFLVNLIVGAVGGTVLFFAATTALPHLLHASTSLREETMASIPVVAAALPVMTLLSVVIGALEGRERFLLRSIIVSGSGVLVQLLPIACAYTVARDVPHLLAATVAAQCVTLAVALVVVIAVLRLEVRPRISRHDAKELARFGSWITVSGVVSPLLTVMDRFAIGALVGPVAVATYTIPFSVVTRVWMIPDALGRVLFPRLSALDAGGATRVMREAMNRLAAVITPVTAVALLLAAPALNLWLGARMGSHAAPVAEVLLLGIWVNSVAMAPYVYLQARGRPDVPALYHLYELLPYVGLLWLGLVTYGVTGAAWAWTIRAITDAGLLYRAADRLGSCRRRTPWRVLLVHAGVVAGAFGGARVGMRFDVRVAAATGVALIGGAYWFRARRFKASEAGHQAGVA